ncbi:LysM peptidoglycan-binding domain-containing protein [Facklamia miroungae]|uniref:LysM domain-containing protein n=1 Tax=Facklamia miroungae TaxID=120956 RepID=A0A1G7PLJ8_9LACT|nr:LysM domain-containing protein [Facklamia miroungae]NKZ28756.1 LysM peptidoglycan-binding domain-containing protein [Facklamia miroungae]SDF87126.1 LysM domain-containing protein [Facklamia miroungae]
MAKDNERFDQPQNKDQIGNEKAKSKKFSAPWNNKFGEDENFKNRQFSRSARNQPQKEATALSKALMFFLIFVLIFPFLLYAYINSQQNSKPVENKTAEQVVLSKKTTEETTTTKEEEKTTTKESDAITREIEETTTSQAPVATTQPPAETPVQTQAPTTYHTVSAGESWWSISQAYGVDVYELAAANGTSIDGTLMPGSQIVIP